MAWLFAIGSACFALGSLPLYFNRVSSTATAVTFFVGSLFFTSAGYIQYYLAINEGKEERRYFDYDSGNPDVKSAAIQSIGTLFFNVSTFAALISGLSLEQENRLIWAPDMFGSAAFLISSWIALEYIRSKIRDGQHPPDWWMAMLNFLGSVAFGLAAVAAVFLPTTGEPLNITLVNAGTFLGACGFFLAAVLVLRTESVAVPAA